LLFLVPAISQTIKVWKILKTFFVKTKTKTKTLGLKTKTKTKTLFFLSSRRLETKTLVLRTTSLIL